MAFQTGLITLKGRIDNMTFYQTKFGMVGRKISGTQGERIKKHPAFVRTRENMSEFGRSGKATSLIRMAFALHLSDFADGNFTNRLVQTTMRIIKSDQVNERGKRTMTNGDLSQLIGVEFNADASLKDCMNAPFDSFIDRATGRLTVDVPVFDPGNILTLPKSATHFRFVAAGAEIDFDNHSVDREMVLSQHLPIHSMTTAISLVCQFPPASTKILTLAFGIQFGQIINENWYPLNDRKNNAMAVVKVEKETVS